jgi:hypothetical protein
VFSQVSASYCYMFYVCFGSLQILTDYGTSIVLRLVVMIYLEPVQMKATSGQAL